MRKRGFTLIELIVTIAIASVLMLVAYNILFTGLRGFSETRTSFEEQTDVRYAVEVTNNAVKFATAGFAVTEDDYKPVLTGGGDVTGLVKPWNYIGLSPGKDAIVHYVFKSDGTGGGTYDQQVLATAEPGSSYALIFKKETPAQTDKILKYTLTYTRGARTEAITTELEAINALHIIDWGDAAKPAVAIAYRTDETPEINKRPVASLAMVLDTSGSMAWGMNGQGTSTTGVTGSNPVRLSLLKNTLTDSSDGLFTVLEDAEAYVGLVPFSQNANIPHGNYAYYGGYDPSKFYNTRNDKATLSALVNLLNTGGATNTGDGLRRAYYQLKKFNSEKTSYGLQSDQPVKNYMVVLVDGVTTVGSARLAVYRDWWVYYGSFKRFITEDGNINNTLFSSRSGSYYRVTMNQFNGNIGAYPAGHGSQLDETYGEPYVRAVGTMMASGTPKIDQCFVIGYSNYKDAYGDYPELESVVNIAKALGIDVDASEADEKFINNEFVFIASDRESLKEAFDNIGGYINEALWQIEGPRLNP